jgi:hypothetical protein
MMLILEGKMECTVYSWLLVTSHIRLVPRQMLVGPSSDCSDVGDGGVIWVKSTDTVVRRNISACWFASAVPGMSPRFEEMKLASSIRLSIMLERADLVLFQDAPGEN